MDMILDMSQSGTLDDADEVTVQFAEHFSCLEQGGSGPKWVARFCKAYVAHVMMGIRVSLEIARKQESGEPIPLWPTDRTVLVRATQGMSTQSYADGASRVFDLERWVPNGVELYEVEGTHFGILNPDSGLAEILNDVVEQS
jgi:fatty acid synthase